MRPNEAIKQAKIEKTRAGGSRFEVGRAGLDVVTEWDQNQQRMMAERERHRRDSAMAQTK